MSKIKATAATSGKFSHTFLAMNERMNVAEYDE